MLKNNGNNGGGNPYHDENGHFTSKGNEGSGAKEQEQQVNPEKVLGQMGINSNDIANATYEAKRDLAYKGGWTPDREGNPKNDVNHFLINKSLNNLLDQTKPYYNETRSNEELINSIVNKDWASELGYQLKNDGVPEEAIPELLEIFQSEAPSWEEVNEKMTRQSELDKLGEKMDNVENRSSDDIELDNEYAEKQKYFNVNGNWTNELEGLKTGLSGQELSDYLKQGLEKRGISDLFVDDYNPNDNMVNFVATDNQGYKVTGWYDRNTGRLGLKANNHQGKDDRWYQDKLGEMGFGDSNGSNQVSPSSKVETTPEQDKQIDEIVNEIFPGKNWRYLMDNTDSPRDIRMGINDFLETGNKDILLRVLKELKDRYNYYRIKI